MNHDELIKEKRLAEATKKKFVGATGKIGIIVQALGKPIHRQGSGLYDVTYLDDPYEAWGNEDNIPYAEDEDINIIGFTFDGLQWGRHIEITYLDPEKTLRVKYKGYLVYEEVAGTLTAYNPFDSWENMIEDIYKLAEKRYKEMVEEQQIALQEEVEREQKNLWQKLKMLWGASDPPMML
jgi:hypothetical protein